MPLKFSRIFFNFKILLLMTLNEGIQPALSFNYARLGLKGRFFDCFYRGVFLRDFKHCFYQKIFLN
ncbi:hypothetical protein [Helicobacter sp. MIT 05-5294]|uniref:hypothetical protein n=1 Tax=Helicobacter sp. MIT 05-5294 TaxID=1548150 RepID=UPI00051FE280|nr:hypothetical protein [Helicobacter sp. MIT 05-5294]TLD88705.1 hypothetical protein LS69_002130 [Helicobacter sp. MIT 05-5294]